MDRLRELGRSPLAIAMAVGAVLLGLITLLSAVGSRRTVASHPVGALEPTTQGYQGLIGTSAVPANVKYVAVLNVPLLTGERVEREMIERRAVPEVVREFPTLRSDEIKDPAANPLDGYYEQEEDAVGKFALVDLQAGMPLGPRTVAGESPLADPLDRLRPDRFTVPMAKEPTLYPLMRPGDRVDVFLVVPGELSRRTLYNVRVVAVNNYLARDSGLLDKRAESENFGSRQQAAQSRRRRILAEQERMNRQGGATKAGTPAAAGKSAQPDSKAGAADSKSGQADAKSGPADAKSGPADAKSGPADATKGEPTKATESAPASSPPSSTATKPGEPGKGVSPKAGALQNLDEKGGNVAKAGKEFDGRAVTLQVSPQEALLLSLAMCTPNMEIEFSLRPRPR